MRPVVQPGVSCDGGLAVLLSGTGAVFCEVETGQASSLVAAGVLLLLLFSLAAWCR